MILMEHLIDHKRINAFMPLYHRFLKCIAWNAVNYRYAKKHEKAFNTKIIDPMEEAWACLTDKEKNLIIKKGEV